MSVDYCELVYCFGYVGFIFFVFGVVLIWLIGDWDFDQYVFVSMVLLVYVVLIIVFFGGIYWGLFFVCGLLGCQLLVWGICVFLLGWLGVLMLFYVGLVLYGGVLIVCYVVDCCVYFQFGVVDWLILCFWFMVVVLLSCFFVVVGS